MSESKKENLELVRAIGAEMCRELFSGYGVELEDVHDIEDFGDVDLCGVIGFTGDDMQGTLLLSISSGVIEFMKEQGELEAGAAWDWVGELANQLLGRIKNRLLRRGIEIYLSPPLVIQGEHLSPLPRSQSPAGLFTCGGQLLCAWIDAKFAPDCVIPLDDQPGSEDVLNEGAALLF